MCKKLTLSQLQSWAELSRSGIPFPELRCTFAGWSIVPDVSYFVLHRIPREPDGEVSNDFFPWRRLCPTGDSQA